MKKLKLFALTMAVIMVFTVCALGCSDSDSSSSSTSETKSAEEKTTEEKNDVAGIGDVVKTEHFEITVTKAQTTKYLKNALNMSYNAADGKEFVFLVFSFKNITDEIHNTSPSYICSVDKVQVHGYNVVGDIDGCMPLVGAVGAGSIFNTYVVVEVAEGWQTLEFEYLDGELGTASQKIVINHSDTTAR